MATEVAIKRGTGTGRVEGGGGGREKERKRKKENEHNLDSKTIQVTSKERHFVKME